MYALAVIRYRRPVEEVLRHHSAHREYLQGLQRQGLLLFSGPLEPRFGGAAVFRLPDDRMPDLLDTIRDNDPYVKHRVAQWEVLPWNVATGKDDLDRVAPRCA
jgi:uncharacterized protein YciI